ncbi:AFP homolog 2-like isoform X2 [Aristolochia californica]|uniref:AFP homolog 2-like isoform X2 n=1 Tax=Aristolochia californica TaxID=171875 RepID=UPI0035DB00CF
MSALAMVSEGEEEVELSLGLSIGGCFRKADKTATAATATTMVNDVFHKSISSPRSSEIDLDCEGRERLVARSNASTLVDAESNAADDLFKRKKELHALRRQEARKKRDEKQQKKGLARRNGFLANNHVPTSTVNDRALLDAQELQCRLSDRAVKEIEASWADRICKKKENGSGGYSGEQNVSLTLNRNQQPASNPNTCSSAPFPVMSMQYPFHPVQYMPYGNGLSFPYMMPCWGPPVAPPTSSGLGRDKNIFQPVPVRPFQPPNSCQNVNQMPGDLERNYGRGTSSGSQGSSASLVSNSQSASLQGSCSDTKSYRSRSPAELTENAKAQSEYSESTPRNESVQITEAKDKAVSKISPGTLEEPTQTGPFSSSKPSSPTQEGVKEPPQSPLLPQMPCVSTTGDGPNGKTIMGFLYRYTKTEVSIVCVCHGSSFSPAEFVKHAGGSDVSHPLKHIIVVPSALG